MAIDEAVECGHCGEEFNEGDMIAYDPVGNNSYHRYWDGVNPPRKLSCYKKHTGEEDVLIIVLGMYWKGRLISSPDERFVNDGRANCEQSHGDGANFHLIDQRARDYLTQTVEQGLKWWPIIWDLRDTSSYHQ